MLVTLFKIFNAFAPKMEQEQGEIFVGERTMEAPAAAAACGSGAAAMHGGPFTRLAESAIAISQLHDLSSGGSKPGQNCSPAPCAAARASAALHLDWHR